MMTTHGQRRGSSPARYSSAAPRGSVAVMVRQRPGEEGTREVPPPWPLDRWLTWATAFQMSSLTVDAVHRQSRPRRFDSPVNTIVRGWLGQRLRDLRCLTRTPSCVGCPETARCDYALVFDPALNASETDRDAEEVPPFWLQGLPAEHALAPDTTLSLRLHAAGAALLRLPYLDVALRDAMTRLGATLSASTVQSVDLGAATVGAAPAAVRISARSPLLLRGDRSACAKLCPPAPWFALLVRSGVRRLDRLRRAFGEPGDRPFLAMPALEALEVVDSLGPSVARWRDERYSHRQDQMMPFNGLVGSAVVRGDCVAALAPLLRALTVTGVGKATTMGFGDLLVEELPD